MRVHFLIHAVPIHVRSEIEAFLIKLLDGRGNLYRKADDLIGNQLFLQGSAGVGPIKYVERQELSPLEDRGVITEIMEELDSYEVKSPNASLGRSETPAERLFAHDSRHHELQQVIFPSSFRPHP